MSEPICPRCRREYPTGWKAEMRKRQGMAIKRALAESDMKLGRPKINCEKDVIRLRREGLSLREIAARLGVSVQPVKRALKESE